MNSKTRKNTIQKAFKESYEANRYYHGTDKKSKKTIEKEGMQLSRKQGGATETLNLSPNDVFVKRAQSHHYMTTSKMEASNYANTQKRGKPKLVRVFKFDVPLEKDPDSPPTNTTAFRTSNNMGQKYFRQKKHFGRGRLTEETKRMFVADMNQRNQGLNATVKELHKMNMSDSEDDQIDIKKAGKMTI